MIGGVLLWTMLFRYQRQVGLSSACSGALLVAFALSRRSHGAFASYFYPESLQAILTFAMLLAWHARRWVIYAACAMTTITRDSAPTLAVAPADVVLLTGVGGPWPLASVMSARPTSSRTQQHSRQTACCLLS